MANKKDSSIKHFTDFTMNHEKTLDKMGEYYSTLGKYIGNMLDNIG